MKRLVYFLASILVGLTATAARSVFADPADLNLTQDKLTMLQRSCKEAQSQLQRIRPTDTVTRTNRGNEYRTIIKLMNAFDSRVAQNKFDASKLSAIASSLDTKVGQLSDNFTKYDNTLSNVITMNCQNQPALFYVGLTQLRGQRAQIASDIRVMDQLTVDYGAGVKEIRAKVAGATPGVTP